MPAETKYHPVPLALIRGYARRCKLKISKIRQIDVSEEKQFAVYQIRIESFPNDRPLLEVSPSELYAALEICFPKPELHVTVVTFTGETWHFEMIAATNYE